MKQIGIVADASDDVLVPDLGQQGSGGRLHCRILPFFFFYGSLMHRHRPFCTACYSGLRPNSLPIIKTYWSPWANASFSGPGPTLTRDAARSKWCTQIHPTPLQAELLLGHQRRRQSGHPGSSHRTRASQNQGYLYLPQQRGNC